MTKATKKSKPISELQITVSKNIRILRDIVDVSQEVFADMTGYHRTYIGSVERAQANITLSSLEAFAKGLAIHPSELLKEDMSLEGWKKPEKPKTL